MQSVAIRIPFLICEADLQCSRHDLLSRQVLYSYTWDPGNNIEIVYTLRALHSIFWLNRYRLLILSHWTLSSIKPLRSLRLSMLHTPIASHCSLWLCICIYVWIVSHCSVVLYMCDIWIASHCSLRSSVHDLWVVSLCTFLVDMWFLDCLLMYSELLFL